MSTRDEAGSDHRWWLVGVLFGSLATTGAVLAPPSLRGEALGVQTAIVGIGGAVGSLLGGSSVEGFGFTIAFVLAGVILFVAAGMIAAFKSKYSIASVTV